MVQTDIAILRKSSNTSESEQTKEYLFVRVISIMMTE